MLARVEAFAGGPPPGPEPGAAPAAIRRAHGPLVVRLRHLACRVAGRRRGRARRHRPRRDLPGEPDPPPRGARSPATRGRSSAGCVPATRRCSPAYLDLGPSPATGAPRALLSASPEPFLSVDGDRQRVHRPDQGHAPSGPDAGRGPGAGSRAARQPQGPGRERDDRGRPAQRPRAGLRAGLGPRAAAPAPGADGRRPAPRDDGHGPAPRRMPTPSTCSRPRFRAGRSPAPRRSGRWRSSKALSRSAAAPIAARWPGSARTGALAPRSSSGPSSPTASASRCMSAAGSRGAVIRPEEWDETVAKARGPLSSIGAVEVER